MDYVVEEVDGKFVIPIAGFVCSYLQNDDELVLLDRDSSDEAWVWATRLEQEAIRLLIEHKASVERAVVAPDSTLRIDFDDGFSLVNPPEREVEAWEMRGPCYVLLVGVPGGGEPAVWDATSEIRQIHTGDPLPAEVARMIELYKMPEWDEYDFQFRPTARGREAIELHPPDAPSLNRKEIIRFVLPLDRPSGTGGPYLRMTN